MILYLSLVVDDNQEAAVLLRGVADRIERGEQDFPVLGQDGTKRGNVHVRPRVHLGAQRKRGKHHPGS